MAHVFFSSYSHVNHDRYLVRFIDRLRHEVRQRSSGALQPDEIGFFDNDGIQTGEEWIARLSNAVCHAKVCIAICSPAFISSEFCGKEIRLFLERLSEWHNKSENAGTVGRAIIPVIWVRTKLPKIISQFQYDESAFPADYLDLGLRTLCQLKKYHDKNMQVVITLAERIVAAAEGNLPPIGQMPHFDHISSAFHEELTGTRYGVAVVAITDGHVDAKPFEAEKTLRERIDDACAQSVPWRALLHDGSLRTSIEQARINREAILIVADFKTLSSPLYKSVIRAVDSAGGEQATLIIYGSNIHDTNCDSLENTLKGHFTNLFSQSWYRHTNVGSSHELTHSLGSSISKMRNRLINEDEPSKAHDFTIVDQAAKNGVPIAHQPILTGPGGKRG